MTAIASQNQTYNLVTQIKPAQLYYYDFLSHKLKIKFTQKPKSFNYIYKATAPNIPITRKEQDLLADLSNMIDRSPNGIIAISQKELSNMTGNKKWQNCVIRKNISHILYSKYKKAVMIDGVLKRKVIIFKYTKKGKGILLDPINNSVTKIKACGRPHAPIYKYEKNINNIRSNMPAHESKFSNNYNSSNIQSENIETTEAKKAKTESTEIKVLVSKKKPLANKRRTVTNSERVIRYQKFKAYDNPKNLSQHYPLSQEDCYELQKRSGKAYSLNAMNEILLDMSRKTELQGHSFVSKAKFMAYMTKAYREEGRDLDKVNSPTFKIMKRRPQAEIEEIVTLNQREKYLNQVENSGINARCDYTQYRARIAGQFPINLAYALLTSMTGVKRQGSVLQITMHKQVSLSQHYKQLLLKHATGVGEYAGVSELEFVGIASNSNLAPLVRQGSHTKPSPDLSYPKKQNDLPARSDLTQPVELQLPKGKWGKVCSLFISQQDNGQALYKHWLEPLSVVEKDGIIELSTSSSMVRDRIEQTYLPFLNKVAGEFGIIEILLV